MNAFDLVFDGYYLSSYNFPEKSGIYCVYISDGKNVTKLAYIGQAENLKNRIQQHASSDYPSDRNYAYSFVTLPKKDLDQVEAALIFRFHPQDNKTLKDKYTHSTVELTISGKCYGLESDTAFIVYNGSETF